MELMEELSFSRSFDRNLVFNQLEADWLNVMALASTMILGSESHEIHDPLLLSYGSGSPQNTQVKVKFRVT